MNLYSIALFVHVVGALLLFVTLTVEGVALRQLSQAAAIESARAGAAMLRLNRIGGAVFAPGVLRPPGVLTRPATGCGARVVGPAVGCAVLALTRARHATRDPG